MILNKQMKEDLKEFEAKVKEILSKDESLIGTIVKVDYICKKTKKKLQRKILI
ncbi:hypothetical protein N5T96_05725 [Aliarcobacter butzleri]|uniref:hypothetical protein n=1 Tax=Aliarcobacter TaxID=2321111 RepID=UPI0021B4058A|nr:MULTISPECIES: hypothetical protein [Aliarcobacter]MCT7485864.1 hypothetical protein [Aliarcobacter cryaerophilus]MCT7489978.1 hypothetical protein [Aliarcobacter cryaerophilus]MCT7565833.1 hypothetical protein [Aliarcobacter butzleri]MCT7577324.1 hypothetical protein [Aliarcobacter butzleri]MCT7582892.1 hypothetical protein [Aliarcobacter butzleri]